MNRSSCKQRSSRAAAFTITELMVSMSILMLVLAAVLSGHLFGMRLFQLTKAKLGANQDSRKALARLTDEIRSAKWIRVGQGGASSFTETEEGYPQQGNSIQIYSTAQTQPWTRYFMDSDQALKRITSSNGAPMTIAQSITNSVVFASENSQGLVLTNNQNNRVISLTMSFYQIQYPILKVGPGEFYDYYQIRTRITRRTLE
jgi:Tfp pilus assembly protein PilW